MVSIPNGFNSGRKLSLNPSTAYLVAWYQTPRGSPNFPPTDEMLIIFPDFCFRMYGRTNCVNRANPKILTSNCRFASTISTSSSAPYEPYPALLINTSTVPSDLIISSTPLSIELSSVTSIAITFMPKSASFFILSTLLAAA